MNTRHIQEDQASAVKHVNHYYPTIERFHKNEILHYFDAKNTDYLVERKTRLERVQTKKEAERYIEEARNTFAGCIGKFSNSEPVHGVVTRTTDKGPYCIDNVLIESLPGYFLTANFYYPKSADVPSPAILFLCGHSVNGKAYTTYVSFCVEAVLNGFCVLTFDPVGQGERKMLDTRDSEFFNGSPDAVHYYLGQQAWLVGDNIADYMMQDNIKALDYLFSRKEADASAVSVCGNSGGGQMAAFMGAYDSRISAVVSSCYITELKSMSYYIGSQECEQSLYGFMQNGLGLSDLVIAAAPKPYMIGASLMDFFPIDGTRDAFIDARSIYRLLECNDMLEIYIAPKPHGFWWDTREKALQFLCRHSGKIFVETCEIDDGLFPSETELLCLEEGDVNLCNSVSLQKLFLAKLGRKQTLPHAIGDETYFKVYQDTLRASLRKVLNLEEAVVCSGIESGERSFHGDAGVYVTGFSFRSEEHMKIYGTLYQREPGNNGAVLVYAGTLDLNGCQLREFMADYSAVFSVEPRGTGRGAVEPGCFFFEADHFENEEASYHCNTVMLGRSLAGMRTRDVLAAVELLKSMGFDTGRIVLGGDDEQALLGLYAAVALGGRDVRLTNLLCSLRSLLESPMYLWGTAVFAFGALRYFDVFELLVVLLPHRVQVTGLMDAMKNRLTDERLQEYMGSLVDISSAYQSCFVIS